MAIVGVVINIYTCIYTFVCVYVCVYVGVCHGLVHRNYRVVVNRNFGHAPGIFCHLDARNAIALAYRPHENRRHKLNVANI